jgi:hypothetical protein
MQRKEWLESGHFVLEEYLDYIARKTPGHRDKKLPSS